VNPLNLILVVDLGSLAFFKSKGTNFFFFVSPASYAPNISASLSLLLSNFIILSSLLQDVIDINDNTQNNFIISFPIKLFQWPPYEFCPTTIVPLTDEPKTALNLDGDRNVEVSGSEPTLGAGSLKETPASFNA